MAAAGPREIASPLYKGRVILENHLSALCLLISPCPTFEITTYFLGRGPEVAFGEREVGLGIWNAVYALDLSASADVKLVSVLIGNACAFSSISSLMMSIRRYLTLLQDFLMMLRTFIFKKYYIAQYVTFLVFPAYNFMPN